MLFFKILLITFVTLSKAKDLYRSKRSPTESRFIAKLIQTPFRLTEGINNFNHDLYNVLDKNLNGNMVFSPFSIHTAMSMVLIGAPSESVTYKQLAKALNVTVDFSEDYLFNYHKALGFYKDLGDIQVEAAYKAYLDEEFDVKPDYETALQWFFKSGNVLLLYLVHINK